MTKVTTRLKNCIRRLFVYNYQLETTHKTLGFCLTGFFPYSNVAMVKAWSSKGLLLETSVPDFLVCWKEIQKQKYGTILSTQSERVIYTVSQKNDTKLLPIT